ncbi:hypothetical protein EW146_g9668 [Bondarzewia mesenterica]|uniref:Uncharacterized protein n=1 Tax=Bondarzewia mesenterica TaxID=1095465 RepID=A0A4S4L4J2_9AGAM|nr:hypothetical protein EW146_g9668 [Bondarzewia mesenterica]
MNISTGRGTGARNASSAALHRLKVKSTVVEYEKEYSDDGEVTMTPIWLSVKALGKRRATEVDDTNQSFNLDDLFYDQTDRDPWQEDSVEEDEEDTWWKPWLTMHYVYDAIIECTQ